MEKLPTQFSIKTINPKLSAIIQKRLFQLGYGWNAGSSAKVVDYREAFIDVGIFNPKGLTYSMGNAFCETVITIEDLLSAPAPSEIKYIEGLPWKTTIGPDHVEFGCQKITRAKFDALLIEIAEFRKGENTLLSEPWYIETTDKYLSEAIQKKLFSLGWKWYPSQEPTTEEFVRGIICSDEDYEIEDKVCTYYCEPGDEDEHIKGYRQITAEELFSIGNRVLELSSMKVRLDETGIHGADEDLSWEAFDAFLKELNN